LCLTDWPVGRANIIVVGRNKDAGEAVLASLPKPDPEEGKPTPIHQFIPCDVTLMSNARTLTDTLNDLLPNLNYLILTAGFLSFKGRDESSEGIDKKLAVDYYSRWVLIHDLLPLLQKSKDDGEDAKVFSLKAAGSGIAIDLHDLGLKKNYKDMGTASTYNDLMVRSFASRHPDIAFAHAHPGVVDTPIYEGIHWAIDLFKPILKLITMPIMVSPQTSAEYMWWGLLDGGKGAFRRDGKGEDMGWEKKYFGTEEAEEKLWEHTVEEVKVKE